MNADDCSFEAAALNHLHDALRASSSDRWQWLKQAMAFGFATARSRAAKGLITIGPQGEVLWSPLHETLWAQKGRLPDAMEVAVFARRP
jgi:hypothetical protein